ncbi:MAG: hypothetical protein ABJJ37_27150 [Roseibium sp.]
MNQVPSSSNLSSQKSTLRRVFLSAGVTFIVFSAIVSGVLITYHFFIVPRMGSPLNGDVTSVEALSFAGVMVTILAFVSGFYILLLAIDAFKISSDVSKNSESIRENLELVASIKSGISSIKERIDSEEKRLELLRSDASLSSDIFRELNSAADDTTDLLHLLDRTSRALELSAESQFDSSGNVSRKLVKHAEAIRNKLPLLSDRNSSRQARIMLLGRLASEPIEIDAKALERAYFSLSAHAEQGDVLAKSLLEKYNSWNQEKNDSN